MNRLILITITFCLYSCTTEVEKSNTFEDNPVVIDLKGLWISDCVPEKKQSFLLKFKVDEKFVSYEESRFNNTADCDSDSYRTVFHTFQGSGAVVLSKPAQAKTLDLKLSWVSAKSIAQTQIDDWNNRSVCGFNDWQINQLKYITGETCEWTAGEPVSYPSIGHKYLDIYSVHERPLTLELGNNLGASKELRPTSFDDRLFFHLVEYH